MSATLSLVVKMIDQASPGLAGVAGHVGKLGAALGGAALGGLLLSAAKGTNDLNNAMAELSTQTGFTGDDLQTVRGAVKDLYKTNVEGQAQIAKTAQEIISRMGVAADAVEGVTDQFLDFARVTKQDSSAAVADFDDILDSWGLTVDDSRALMDKLVVSQQKFGTQTGAAQKAISTLAPTFKTLGLNMDDALGFINAFSDSGIEAGETAVAFNAAVGKVSGTAGKASPELDKLAAAFNVNNVELTALNPEQRFQVLIEKLQNIEDPAARSAAAIELFGAKAGVKLAATLDPARGGLEQYTLALQGSEGAAKTAAETIDSTLNAKLTVLGHQVLGRASDLTEKLGPAFQIIAAVAGPLAPAIGAVGGAIAGMGAEMAAANPEIFSALGTLGAFAVSLPGVITTIVGVGAAFLYVRGQMEGAEGPLESLGVGLQATHRDYLRLLDTIPLVGDAIAGLPGPRAVKEWDELSKAEKAAATAAAEFGREAVAAFNAVETEAVGTGASIEAIDAAQLDILTLKLTRMASNITESEFGEFWQKEMGTILTSSQLTSGELDTLEERILGTLRAGRASPEVLDGVATAFDGVTASSSQAAGALLEARVEAGELPAGLGPAITEVDKLTQSADDARDALFKMFTEPTKEEAAASSVLANYELQLSEINDKLIPLDENQRLWLDSLGQTGRAAELTELQARGLTLAEAEQYLLLKGNLIPEQRDHLDYLNKIRDAAGKEAEAKHGTLLTQDQWRQKIADGTLTLAEQDRLLAGLVAPGSALNTFRHTLDTWPGYKATTIETFFKGAVTSIDDVKVVTREHGGIVGQRELSYVGERGPELVSLPAGSRVHTAQQTQRMLGGGEVHFHYHDHSMFGASPAERQKFQKMVVDVARGAHR